MADCCRPSGRGSVLALEQELSPLESSYRIFYRRANDCSKSENEVNDEMGEKGTRQISSVITAKI